MHSAIEISGIILFLFETLFLGSWKQVPEQVA